MKTFHNVNHIVREKLYDGHILSPLRVILHESIS